MIRAQADAKHEVCTFSSSWKKNLLSVLTLFCSMQHLYDHDDTERLKKYTQNESLCTYEFTDIIISCFWLLLVCIKKKNTICIIINNNNRCRSRILGRRLRNQTDLYAAAYQWTARTAVMTDLLQSGRNSRRSTKKGALTEKKN